MDLERRFFGSDRKIAEGVFDFQDDWFLNAAPFGPNSNAVPLTTRGSAAVVDGTTVRFV